MDGLMDGRTGGCFFFRFPYIGHGLRNDLQPHNLPVLPVTRHP